MDVKPINKNPFIPGGRIGRRTYVFQKAASTFAFIFVVGVLAVALGGEDGGDTREAMVGFLFLMWVPVFIYVDGVMFFKRMADTGDGIVATWVVYIFSIVGLPLMGLGLAAVLYAALKQGKGVVTQVKPGNPAPTLETSGGPFERAQDRRGSMHGYSAHYAPGDDRRMA